MVSTINTQAFLCGYFSIDGKTAAQTEQRLDLNIWQRQEYTKDSIGLLSDFYYPEFVEFCTKARRTYRHRIDKDLSNPCRFHVGDIQIGFYPFGIVIFHVRLTFRECTPEQVRKALGKLRNCCFYEDAGLDEFIDTVIEPIKKAYSDLGGTADTSGVSCPYLVESGNKFKLFQIVEGEAVPKDDKEMDRFLYSCGTLAEYDENALYSTSRDYYEKSLAESRLSVFNNWKALMLLDSVTFAALEVSDFSKKIWTSDYFGMIYLYELYRKIYLYELNMRFRSEKEKASKLFEELQLFERKYTFSSISYNFLPNEVDKAIEKNLNTRQVEADIYHVIDQETTAQAAEHESRTNLFLTFLTLMASLSAVWDISSMLDAIVNYEQTFNLAATGYRLVVTLLIVVILLVALFSRRKKH